MKLIKKSLFILFMLIFFLGVPIANSQTKIIRGQVIDKSFGNVSNIEIQIKNVRTKTDKLGLFKITIEGDFTENDVQIFKEGYVIKRVKLLNKFLSISIKKSENKILKGQVLKDNNPLGNTNISIITSNNPPITLNISANTKGDFELKISNNVILDNNTKVLLDGKIVEASFNQDFSYLKINEVSTLEETKEIEEIEEKEDEVKIVDEGKQAENQTKEKSKKTYETSLDNVRESIGTQVSELKKRNIDIEKQIESLKKELANNPKLSEEERNKLLNHIENLEDEAEKNRQLYEALERYSQEQLKSLEEELGEGKKYLKIWIQRLLIVIFVF